MRFDDFRMSITAHITTIKDTNTINSIAITNTKGSRLMVAIYFLKKHINYN